MGSFLNRLVSCSWFDDLFFGLVNVWNVGRTLAMCCHSSAERIVQFESVKTGTRCVYWLLNLVPHKSLHSGRYLGHSPLPIWWARCMDISVHTTLLDMWLHHDQMSNSLLDFAHPLRPLPLQAFAWTVNNSLFLMKNVLYTLDKIR